MSFTKGSLKKMITCMWYLVERERKYSFTLGIQESASWKKEGVLSDTPAVVYEYAEKTAIVFLQCSTTGEEHLEVVGEVSINLYEFRLTHRCACWNGCSGKSIFNRTILA